jgi:hypothetical protein
MTNDENTPKRVPWDLVLAVGVSILAAYLQRKATSITFADAIQRISNRVRTVKADEPLPRDFARDLYDSTR